MKTGWLGLKKHEIDMNKVNFYFDEVRYHILGPPNHALELKSKTRILNSKSVVLEYVDFIANSKSVDLSLSPIFYFDLSVK